MAKLVAELLMAPPASTTANPAPTSQTGPPRVIVSRRQIIDRHKQALDRGKLRGHGATQTGRERGDAALSYGNMSGREGKRGSSDKTFEQHRIALWLTVFLIPVEGN